MDEGLGFALIPIFVIVLPIVISFALLYAILKDKKMSFFGSIIGFLGAFIIGYVFGLFWYFANIDIIAQSPFAPYILVIISGILTAIVGLIVIKVKCFFQDKNR